ncbi:hypothetical protein B9T23_09615 [Acinetobacter terrae]|nr:hypothetical protein B9T23_09615 [Acinetobacter terrae]
MALSFVQIVNYILPFLLIPYFLKTLGSDGWGRIIYIQLILQYFVVVVTYGFQWSAVNKISPIRSNKDEVNKLFSSYFLAQCLLIILCLLIFIFSSLIFDKVAINFKLILIGFLGVIGAVVFPVWLMQALEQLKFMALVQLIVQLLCFLCIFLFVKNTSDLDYALFFQSINNLIVGLICFIFLYNKGYKIRKINFLDLKLAYIDGFTLFVSQLWISLYTNSIPVILGILSNNTAVATYSVADKIQKAVRFLLNPISRAIFPRISFLQKNDLKKADRLLHLSMLFTFLVTIFGGILLLIFSDKIIQFLNAESLPNIYSVIYILAVMPVLVGMSSVIAIQALIPKGYSSALNKIWFSACFITLVLSIPIISEYGVVGATILAVLVEACILIMMLIVLMRGKK